MLGTRTRGGRMEGADEELLYFYKAELLNLILPNKSTQKLTHTHTMPD